MRKTNSAGLELIKHFEGLKLKSYQDAVNVWTIGYGHTKTAKPGQAISEPEAERLLKADLHDAESAVNRMVRVPLTDNQFDALVSFVFNLGAGSFQRSTLLRKLNAGEYQVAANEFLKWNKAGGRVLAGLTRRRRAEQALFTKV
jgi:GH24 family phage-related lysozyme (muramidase)